ncbi:MAG: hypothetical protein ACI9OD_005261, partial [Limisphaerales bacterium]
RGPNPITLWVTPLGEMHAIPLPPKNTKGSYMTIRVRGEPGKLNIGLKNSRVKRAEVLDANCVKTDEIKIANGRFSYAG